MIQIKIYTNRRYYVNKWGEKEYLIGGEGDNILIKAAMLTGNGLISEEYCFYHAYGETKEEAEKAIANYIKANPQHPIISRTEIIETT